MWNKPCRTGAAAACTLAWMLALGAAHAEESTEAIDQLDIVRTVEKLIAEGACGSALEEIGSGLKKKQPHILLLAGTMFDHGACVKPDWNKAATLYIRAEEAGEPDARLRLAAGYARPGRDNGMALWWAARGPLRDRLPAVCVPAANPVTQSAAFNDALEKMAPPTFQACVYIVGVASEIATGLRFPPAAANHDVTGRYRMSFDPADGRVTWTPLEVDAGGGRYHLVRNAARIELEDPRAVRESLQAYFTGASDLALARYPRPAAGWPPGYVFNSDFSFVGLGRQHLSRLPLQTFGDAGPRGPGVILARPVQRWCDAPALQARDLAPLHPGIVQFHVEVDAEGKVVDTRVERSSGHAPLDDVTRAAMASCRFKPATQDGKPVPSWAKVLWNWAAMVPPPPPYGANVVRAHLDTSKCEWPKYPEQNNKFHDEGTARLLYWMGADGKLKVAEIVHSSGFATMDASALDAVTKCALQPVLVNGQPVDSWDEIDFTWYAVDFRRR